MEDSPQSGSGPQRHAISCINCRTRKVKCDKIYPCSPCQKLQVECNFRAKKARPKKAIVSKSKSSDINSRLDRLDQLVSRLGSLQHKLPGDVQSLLTNSSPDDNSRAESGPGTGKPPKEPDFGKGYPQMRSEFWMNLSDEVDGLRHILYGETSDEEEESSDDEGLPQASMEGSVSSSSVPFIFGSKVMPMEGRKHPQAAEVLRLSEVFFDRVDVLFKYVHAPTVRDLISRVIAQGERPTLSKPEQALMFSIYYSAVNALSDEEYALHQQDRRSALLYYKVCTESALADADLLCVTDTVTLQAFITYLLALRNMDSSQACWSLIGLAIRLAQALDLHKDTSCNKMPPYDIQMRRRLYWQLCLMDVQSFHDRGLSPLMHSTGPSFPTLPANVDDSDFDINSRESVVSRVGLTDMTAPLLSYQTTQTALRLASRPNSSIQPDANFVTEELRTLHNTVVESMKYFDMTKPVYWFSQLVFRIAMMKIFLLAHIPVHVRLRKVQPDITKCEVISLCITILELHQLVQEKEPLRRFGWCHNNWHQWHPLAVALAELISTPTGPLADRAWLAVSSNFDRWKSSVADGHKGGLWRPIKKLYDKARKSRLQAMGVKVASPSSGIGSDASSPAADLGLPRQPDSEQMHILHDQAFSRAVGLRPGETSPLLFLPPEQATMTPDSLVVDYTGSNAKKISNGSIPQQTAINWDDWDAFLKESWESGVGIGSERFDESLMQGIMEMPLSTSSPAAPAPAPAPYFQPTSSLQQVQVPAEPVTDPGAVAYKDMIF